MAEKEYIDRGLILGAIAKYFAKADDSGEQSAMDIWKGIKKIPAADVVEVKHGEWIDRDEKTWCSNCDASNKQYKPPYCPHCGAKMDGGKHETD